MSTPPSWLPRAFVVPDVRLTRVFQHQPQRCASVSEYAQATGIDVLNLLELLGPALDAGTIALEPVGAETFIHTAPNGRPVPHGLPDPLPNLWETLRADRGPQAAYELWTLYRALQTAGWAVEARPTTIAATLGPIDKLPTLAVLMHGELVPVVIGPSTAALADPQGRLGELARAGAKAAAATLPSGALDDFVTAARAWFNRADHRGMKIVLLEAPRYAPVIVSAADAAVAPRAVESTDWEH